MIPEDLVPVEADITPDEWAAPSDISWRIEEIHVEVQYRNEEPGQEIGYYRQWLDRLIDLLLFVEGGGV